jgi:hypothetical protein
MARLTMKDRILATVQARIVASDKKTRHLLLAELLNSPPEICRFGLNAAAWRRFCLAAVADLPADHFVKKAFPDCRLPSVLSLLRSRP